MGALSIKESEEVLPRENEREQSVYWSKDRWRFQQGLLLWSSCVVDETASPFPPSELWNQPKHGKVDETLARPTDISFD